jgi:hypothetical protein
MNKPPKEIEPGVLRGCVSFGNHSQQLRNLGCGMLSDST